MGKSKRKEQKVQNKGIKRKEGYDKLQKLE